MTVRVAVTGATGRLGSAVLDALGHGAGSLAIGWTRREFDLDAPATAIPSLDRDRPDVVVHCAAWTDVDGCAREPALAERRNGLATGALAAACAERGVDLVAVSTNEVFDGRRTDRQPYRPSDETAPGNPYGRSKLLGETAAREAFAASGAARLWIVRTAWLFGGSGRDFPAKIVEAARIALAAGQPLRVVTDEIGNPTFAGDLASGIVDLIGDPGSAGVHHVVNDGFCSRADWARRVLRIAAVDVLTDDVPADTWHRDSVPPRWGVLEPTALPTLGRLQRWEAAVDEDLGRRHGTLAAQGVAP
jgi:dTDP-4-dehydrorhamnose reductase